MNFYNNLNKTVIIIKNKRRFNDIILKRKLAIKR